MKRGFLLRAAPRQAKPPAATAKANKGSNNPSNSHDETLTAAEVERQQREGAGFGSSGGGRGESTARQPTPTASEGRVPDWSALPDLVLGAIARRLPTLMDFFSFRGVCMSWRSVGRAVEGVLMASHPPLFFEYPFLNRFYHPAEKRVYKRKSIKPLWDPEGPRFVAGFSHGHLVLRRYGPMTWLENPLTGAENHCIPGFPRPERPFHEAFLSSPPTSPGCVLVAYDFCNIQYCRPGGKQWYDVYLPDTEHSFNAVYSVAVVGGKGYALLERGELVTFDFTENPRLTTLSAERVLRPPLGMHPTTRRAHSTVHLAESKGELFAFSTTEFGVVFRFDSMSCKWVWSEDLGGRAVFVDGWLRGSIFVDNYAKWGGGKDCIYFFDPPRRQVLEYRVKDGRSKPRLFPARNPVKDCFTGFWVLPSLSN